MNTEQRSRLFLDDWAGIELKFIVGKGVESIGWGTFYKDPDYLYPLQDRVCGLGSYSESVDALIEYYSS